MTVEAGRIYPSSSTTAGSSLAYGIKTILLVIPPAPAMAQWSPELAVAYLAGSLRSLAPYGIRYEIEVLDCINRNYSVSDFRDFIYEREPFGIVGFKIFSLHLASAAECIKHVKQRSPETITLAGGPHVSVLAPEEVMEDLPGLDYAIAGEAIRSFPMFVRNIVSGKPDKGEIFGLIWRDGERILHNGPDFEVDMDFHGLPDWSLVKPGDYSSREPYSFYTTGWPVAQIVSSRGCPFRCSFCSSFKFLGRKVRFRKIDNIIKEMKMLVDEYGVRSIEFVDDNFLTNREYTAELCRRIIDEKIEVEWSCPQGLHLNGVDAETISLMYKAGCRYIAVGIESGSDRILKKVGKGLTREKIKRQIGIIKENTKIKILGFFIIGFPTETEEEMEETVRFATELPIDLASFAVYVFLPGTMDTEDLLASNPEHRDLIRNLPNLYRWSEHKATDVTNAMYTVPVKRLNSIKQKAHRRFFLRPKVLFSLIRELNSPMKIKIMLRWLRMHFY